MINLYEFIAIYKTHKNNIIHKVTGIFKSLA